ncbi:MAG: phosphate butyryltransferase [Firmicutes bacterium]|nr:phosphate butyryltransferase [Bacillota bacterium]
MITSLEEVLAAAVDKGGDKMIAVAAAHDKDVLAAIKEAYRIGLATAILVGDAERVHRIAAEIDFDLDKIRVIHEPDPVAAARAAVRLVRRGEAQMLMKGLVNTADILRAVLDKENGLRTGRVLSHIAIMEALGYGRLLLLTDGGMNIAPDLKQKAQLIANAVDVARCLGIDCPKVALITAFEQVNPDMPATIEAALLAKMADRGQIKHCIVDGPIALDGAVSVEAAAHKGIQSPVAGQADILLVPTIEVGNAIYKTLVYLGGGCIAGIVAGAAAPVILASRADTSQVKLYSIAAAVLTAN